ncbi:MAG: hypothetical protein WA825_09205 [Steroidobacteraceae bacterium]
MVRSLPGTQAAPGGIFAPSHALPYTQDTSPAKPEFLGLLTSLFGDVGNRLQFANASLARKDLATVDSQFADPDFPIWQGADMYELILTVMVTFGAPVADIDGHGVAMVTQRYVVAVQGFATKEDCLSFDGYQNLESSLTSTFGSQTKVTPETTANCKLQRVAATASN